MEFRLLGAVEAWSAGRQLDLGPRKQRLALAVLALRVNQLVSVDRLVDLTWPSSPPQTAQHAIHARVSRLRAALAQADAAGDGIAIVTHGSSYVLRADPMTVDAHRFRAWVAESATETDDVAKVRQLRAALDLWHGPPLADVATPDVADQLCRGLEEARLTALEECLEAELRLGRHGAVIGELVDLAAQHPYRQHLLAQLMLALYRAGRGPDALTAYRLARCRLVEEIGLDPEPRLQQLASAILCADPALDLSGTPGSSEPPRLLVRDQEGRLDPAEATRVVASEAVEPPEPWRPDADAEPPAADPVWTGWSSGAAAGRPRRTGRFLGRATARAVHTCRRGLRSVSAGHLGRPGRAGPVRPARHLPGSSLLARELAAGWREGVSAMSDVTVDARRLTKTYGRRTAVADLSFTARQGEVLGLLGSNGAGKTTTIRLLTTMLRPTSGEFSVAGIPSTRPTEIRCRVGVLPEGAGYPGHQTGLDYLTYHARLFGMTRSEAARTAARLLAELGLGERAGSRISTYSRGMRQRLGIARALLNEPSVVLLDEPTLGLDPAGRHLAIGLVREIAQRSGATVLLSTNALPEVEEVCTNVLVLDAGRLALSGTVAEVTPALAGRCVGQVRVPAGLADRASRAVQGVSGVAVTVAEGRPDVLRVSLAGTGRAPGDVPMNAVLQAVLSAGVPVLSAEADHSEPTGAFLPAPRRPDR
jgi:ABC-2 type transport system ATP-binding protein